MYFTYKPSGRVPAVGLVGLPLASLIFSLPLAWAYALALHHRPSIWLGVLAAAGWGLLAGLNARAWVSVFKFRSPALAGLLALIASLGGYYVAWIFFFTGPAPLDLELLSRLFLAPEALWEMIRHTYENGHFALGWLVPSKSPVTGPFLAAAWAGEALIYFGLIVHLAVRRAARPFSESAGKWIPPVKLSRIMRLPGDKAKMTPIIEQIKGGQTSPALNGEGNDDEKDRPALYFELYAGEDSEEHYLSVSLLNYNSRGAKDAARLIRHLAISPIETQTIVNKYG